MAQPSASAGRIAVNGVDVPILIFCGSLLARVRTNAVWLIERTSIVGF